MSDMFKALTEVIAECNNGDFTSWSSVAEKMKHLGFSKTAEGWRAYFRKQTNPDYDKQRKRGTLLRDLRRSNAMNLPTQLVQMLKKKRSLEYLIYNLKKTKEEILSEMVELQLHGYKGISIWEENGEIYLQNVTKAKEGNYDAITLDDLYDGKEIRFAVVSDTHMGSKFEALNELHMFYDYCAEQGIDTVFHVGDISDGFYTNRMTSIRDLHAVGFSEQLTHIIENYPHVPSIHTYFITGNHDYTHMRNGFADIGEEIDRNRDDMTYLGHNFAKIDIYDGIDLALIHPTDGSSRTLSLKLQNIVDHNPYRRASIMVAGHYHKSIGMKYKGVYAYLVPSFQHQTGFMADNNLQSDVAGMIFTLKVTEGEIRSVVTEYVDFDKKF
jgi:UDP-2,3-diacylglucosamine pyrophosphatase LpxH